MNWLKWFRPGIGIKRWLLIIAVGIGLISYGLGSLLRTLYFYPAIPRPLWYATLQFVPYRNWLLMAAGAASCALGIVALFRSLMSPFALGGEQKAFIDILHEYHQLRRGPKAVVIGGGNGVEIALRGLKEYSENLTAILPPARDRAAHSDLLPAAPLEEVTSCLLALAQTEPLMARLLDYRLQDRYSFGELFLSVMADIAGGLEQGIRESGRILAVRGQVLTSSESRMAAGPEAPAASQEALRAILDADLIVVGPGDLYSKILPTLLVFPLARAVKVSSAVKVYVCNVANEPGPGAQLTVRSYVKAVCQQAGYNLFRYVLVNNNFRPYHSALEVNPVAIDGTGHDDIQLIEADIVDENDPRQHDPAKLARALLELYGQRAGWGARYKVS
jgi:2-phospho-L-lactate transferase/gluconeogenesis factor (CofD/UPF0052 family)